jgi:cell wall-associated NlpC family hydrolase
MGNVTDRNGNSYYDCSGLCFTAYKKLGVTLGGNWTGAMRSTWRNWADQVPKNPSAMKPGDLILMDGHVVMYIGNGKCVGAQTSNTAWDRQVTADINVQTYLKRSDAIVLRPHV